MSSLSCGSMQLKCLRDACAGLFWDWSKDKNPSFTPGIFTEFQRILNETNKLWYIHEKYIVLRSNA